MSSSTYESQLEADMRSSPNLLAQVRVECYHGPSCISADRKLISSRSHSLTVAALEDINTALDTMKAHEVTGRMWSFWA